MTTEHAKHRSAHFVCRGREARAPRGNRRRSSSRTSKDRHVLLNQLGDTYTRLLLDHRAILRTSLERWRGVEVDTQGDSFFVAFATVRRGCLRHSTRGEPWKRTTGRRNWVRVRMVIRYRCRPKWREAATSGSRSTALRGSCPPARRSDPSCRRRRQPWPGSIFPRGKPRRSREYRLPRPRRHRRSVPARTSGPDPDSPLRTLDYRPATSRCRHRRSLVDEQQLEEIGGLLIGRRPFDHADRLGGTGRTRLALRAARHLEHVLDGVFFVDWSPSPRWNRLCRHRPGHRRDPDPRAAAPQTLKIRLRHEPCSCSSTTSSS